MPSSRSSSASHPKVLAIGALLLVAATSLVYLLSSSSDPAATGLARDIAAARDSMESGASTAEVMRGAKPEVKKILATTTTAKAGEGHWEHVTGEDGHLYTQWRSGDSGAGAQVPGLMKGHLAVKAIVTEVASDGIKGMTTYSLSLARQSGSKARNIYTVFGDKAAALTMPPAYNVAAPFGAAIGGANPAFFKLKPEAEYDSWLTVGLTDGNSKNQISKIGIDFEKWDLQTPLHADDGAVFWMDPDDAPLFENTESIDVAQVTVKSGMGIKAAVNAQGRSNVVGSDWVQQGILFKSK